MQFDQLLQGDICRSAQEVDLPLLAELGYYARQHGVKVGSTPCVVCDRVDIDKGTTIANLVRCRVCGLGWLEPQASAAELAAIYDSEYYRPFGVDSAGMAGYRRLKRKTIERFLKEVERLAGSRSRLIDVGSALGDVLAAGRRRGWFVRGVEPIANGARAAESVAPGATFPGALEELPLGEEPFDLVTCLDVLEHLRSPDAALQKMHDLLVPGGILLATVPDAGSLLARVLGARWPHYHRDHLWYFTRATLRRLVEKCGFEVLRHGQCWKTFNFRYVLGILANHPHTGLLHAIAKRLKDRLPRWVAEVPWPPIPEGQLILARKPR